MNFVFLFCLFSTLPNSQALTAMLLVSFSLEGSEKKDFSVFFCHLSVVKTFPGVLGEKDCYSSNWVVYDNLL